MKPIFIVQEAAEVSQAHRVVEAAPVQVDFDAIVQSQSLAPQVVARLNDLYSILFRVANALKEKEPESPLVTQAEFFLRDIGVLDGQPHPVCLCCPRCRHEGSIPIGIDVQSTKHGIVGLLPGHQCTHCDFMFAIVE